MIRFEDVTLPQDDINASIGEVRKTLERLGEKLRGQAVHLQRLEENLRQLRDEHGRLEAEVWDQIKALGEAKSVTPSTPLEAVLVAARNLLSAILPKQLFSNLAEESYRFGVRSVAFEVRGEAAWAASACGFGPLLTEQSLHSLVVPLSVDTPFRQVFELGVELGGESKVLAKNPNVLNRLKPDSQDSILLLPIRAGGGVAAILYADSGGKGALPKDALKLLAEFAGARLEHLMALAGRTGAATG